MKPRFLESGVAHLERQKSQRQRYAFGIAIEKTPQTSKHEKEWQGEGIGRGKSGKKISNKMILNSSYRFCSFILNGN